MAIRTRQELELCFKNGTLPSEKNFQDLIHSMLNRKDDKFFGKWKAGMRYCPGDVVFCKKSFYIALGTEKELDCNSVNEPINDDESACFCSTDSPDQDKNRWGPLELEVSDEDWVVLKGKDVQGRDDVMYAGIWGKIGIETSDPGITDQENVQPFRGKIGMGTSDPKARLDITVKDKGSFLFDPGDENTPEFVIRDATCKEIAPEVRQSVNEKEAYWYINVSGYAFKKLPEPNDGDESPIHPDLLMFITTDEREMPAVGIGTNSPDAALDAKESGKGQILLRPGGSRNPEVIVVNLKGGKDFDNYTELSGARLHEYVDSFFKISVGKNATVFRNPYEKKFLFTRMKQHAGPLDEFDRHALLSNDEQLDVDETKKKEEVLMAITQHEDDEGNLETMVGIGTEKPRAHLEVTDGESGSILLSLNKTNPALAILNMRPRFNQANYMTLGVNNKRGVFVTDSPNGFEFRQGNPCGDNDNELDIDQHGRILLSISGDAKVGVGKRPSDSFELDLEGEIKSFGYYLETHRDSVENTERLNGKEMLDKLRKIHPVSFNWKDSAWKGPGSKARQIGVLGHEVGEVFEELVKNLDDGNHAVAYQNMVAVLIAAVNELNREVKDLKEKLDRRD